MIRFVSMMLLAIAVPASADTLSDLRAAVGRLGATQPIRATFTTEQLVKSKGRFSNQDINRTASAEVVQDDRGISITIPKALVDRVASDRRAGKVSDDIAQGPIGSLRTLDITDAIDFRESLLQTLEGATVSGEKRVTHRGRPARQLALKLKPRERNEENTVRIGSVKADDQMTLWIGDDNLPISADRTTKVTGGFMFIKGTFTSRRNYSFAAVADRLVLARLQTADSGSGMGQDVARNVVQTLVVQ